MSDQKAKRTEDAIARAVKIAGRIARGDDLRVREKIEAFPTKLLQYRKHNLCIAEDAWRHVAEAGIERRLVFAHPAILKAIPEASVHYRGIALLSLKRVEEIAGAVTTWERSPEKARITDEKALRVCRLYNAVIGSIIVDNTDWTLRDGYRNILATLGITEDGAIRNIIGQEAEKAVKERLLDWTRTQGLLDDAEPAGQSANEWRLIGGVCMRFGSEPDIAFEKNGASAVVVEIKGGKDRAGAQERLGAIKKTFDKAPAGCKKFPIVGVVTKAMRKQLDEMRIEKYFDIDQLLDDDDAWQGFMNEIFHHALRIAPEGSTAG